MSVDPGKQRKVLVVHGVRLGEDSDIDNHKTVQTAMEDRLDGLPLDFECSLFSYENMNNAALKKFTRLSQLLDKALASKVPVLGLLKPTENLTDLIGDVVVNLKDGETAKAIRAELKSQLEQYYSDGHHVTVVAHSLGSIYALDVLNELIKETAYFHRDDRSTWPVQGLVTIGSPIGIPMFRKCRSTMAKLGDGANFMRWSNIWDGGDPIVTGSIFGKPAHYPHVAEHYRNNAADFGWYIKDTSIDSGRAWLMAHISYWNTPAVIDEVIRLVTT